MCAVRKLNSGWVKSTLATTPCPPILSEPQMCLASSHWLISQCHHVRGSFSRGYTSLPSLIKPSVLMAPEGPDLWEQVMAEGCLIDPAVLQRAASLLHPRYVSCLGHTHPWYGGWTLLPAYTLYSIQDHVGLAIPKPGFSPLYSEIPMSGPEPLATHLFSLGKSEHAHSPNTAGLCPHNRYHGFSITRNWERGGC